jgi:hypothetical protein
MRFCSGKGEYRERTRERNTDFEELLEDECLGY